MGMGGDGHWHGCGHPMSGSAALPVRPNTKKYIYERAQTILTVYSIYFEIRNKK